VVHSRRGRLLTNAMAVVIIGIVAGVWLQSWPVIQSSPLGRLSSSTGLPVIALVVSALAIWLGATIALDGWNHRVTFGPHGLTIHDAHGTFSVSYSDVECVKEAPLGSVAIALRDPESWLNSLASGAELRRRMAGAIRQAHGADMLLHASELHVGASKFVDLVRARVSGAPHRGGTI
jgi:hypothetical protein